MRFKLAILNVLAKSLGGRATLDEVRREVRVYIADVDQTEQLKRFSALGDIDIFQSGLIVRDDGSLRITDAGLSLLHSLETSSDPSLEFSSAPAPQQPLSMEERLDVFDLELRALDNNVGQDTSDNRYQSQQEAENGSVDVRTPDAIPETRFLNEETNRTGAIKAADAVSQDASTFLQRSFGSRVPDPEQESLRLASLLAFIATKKQFLTGLWRQHFSDSLPLERTERSVLGGAAFALLSLVVVVACVGAAIALGQIKSLKSEIALLHREVLALKEGLARQGTVEKTKPGLEQQEQDIASADKNKAGGELRPDQTGLNLSREEIQLIREYIKPAPSAGAAAAAINVGDPVGGATIPLPAPLMEKIPKLLGARFTTRNGSIIIVGRGSRQADAVLPSN